LLEYRGACDAVGGELFHFDAFGFDLAAAIWLFFSRGQGLSRCGWSRA
jgi:hypothetical protein